jgi:hypothetical protein
MLRRWELDKKFPEYQGKKPKAMTEDIPLEEFASALFHPGKKLDTMLRQRGFDDDDVKIFLEATVKLFKNFQPNI